MICQSCNKDVWPSIEGDQAGRFVYICPEATCHGNMGPVIRSDAGVVPGTAKSDPPAQPPASVATVAAKAPAAALSVAQKTAAPASSESYVDQMRSRLAELDAVLDPLNEERDFLRRMLRAADRKAKKPSTSKNVIPISKAATS